jgi:hypothetical protein
MLATARMAITVLLECPFCGETGPARSFVRLGAFDAPACRIELVARLPS